MLRGGVDLVDYSDTIVDDCLSLKHDLGVYALQTHERVELFLDLKSLVASLRLLDAGN